MNFIINQLQNNKDTLFNLLNEGDNDFIYWKQSPEKWCLLEIVCHLYDEERDDFRFRVNWILEKPGEIPPPFNPLDWVTENKYMQQDYKAILYKFIAEREASINWLNGLKDPNWNNFFNHPKVGKLTAKYFLDNWLAHDYLHMRQILKLKFDFLKHQSKNNLDYAGKW